MDRLERAKAYAEKINGKFREGDRVAYSMVVSDPYLNKRHTISCTGIITAIESDGIYIRRDRGGETDWKSPVELRKA